jgi:hypothetical protein
MTNLTPYWAIKWQGTKPESCMKLKQSCKDKDLRPVSGLPLHDEVDEEISNKV